MIGGIILLVIVGVVYIKEWIQVFRPTNKEYKEYKSGYRKF